MADPYVYPGTTVLRNVAGIRDRQELERFERVMTMTRREEGLPPITMTPAGYCLIHRHIFQDVYSWAGKLRTVSISKNDQLFCLPQHLERELAKRFAAINADLPGTTPDQFAFRMAEHLSELNAIHPFRDGNGRTMREFLEAAGARFGHPVDLTRIQSRAWNEASIESFKTGALEGMHRVVLGALKPA